MPASSGIPPYSTEMVTGVGHVFATMAAKHDPEVSK
jgi:hypothetical protein